MNIDSPHIPYGSTLESALEILSSIGEVEKYVEERETFYKASSKNLEVGVYYSDGRVTAAWYNDPAGRDSEEGINLKVTQYLERYGDLDNWEEGINNGWIQFFNNQIEKTGLAYGLHKDVLRFNFFE